MNTDNFSILGLTLDFGPYQFLDTYDPAYICNASDDTGRYAYRNQPGIGLWNLTKLATAIVPLVVEEFEELEGSDSPAAAAQAELVEALREYMPMVADQHMALMQKVCVSE